MQQAQLMAHCGSSKITRGGIESDSDTRGGAQTHQPLPHFEIVGALGRNLELPADLRLCGKNMQFSTDGMKMFGVLDLETTFDGCRFSIGVRNSNDKSMPAGSHRGLPRVLYATTWRFQGDFTPVLAKHTKTRQPCGHPLDRPWTACSGTSNPMRKQVDVWKQSCLTDEAAKLIIYRAFVEGALDVPKTLERAGVHDQ